MKKYIQTEHEVAAPIDKVWAAIAKGDQVESWIPIIKSSRLDGKNHRSCEMIDGGELEETILASEGTKTFMYSIDKQDAFPAKDIVATIRLKELAEDQTQLFWDVELEAESEESFQELKQNIEQIYSLSANKLVEIV